MWGFSSGAVQQDPVKQELGKLKCYFDSHKYLQNHYYHTGMSTQLAK